MKKSAISLTLAASLLSATLNAQAPPANYDETKVGKFTLPDPLTFNNGKPVRSAKDWTKRRPEIFQAFASDVYGYSPQAPKQLDYKVFETNAHALSGKAVRKQITIYFSGKENGPKEDVLLYLPAGNPKPVPVILSLNFSGNHAVVNEPWDKACNHLDPQNS